MTRFRTKTEAQEAIDETAAKIAAGEALLTPLQQELADITARLGIYNPSADRTLVRRQAELKESIRLLHEGFGRDDGYTTDVAHLYPYRGLNTLRVTLASFQQDLQTLVRAESTLTRPYRVRGPEGEHPYGYAKRIFNAGKFFTELTPGKVLMLTERVANQWPHIFEPVTEDDAPSAPEATESAEPPAPEATR